MKGDKIIQPRTVPLWPDAGRILGYGKEVTYEKARQNEIKTVPIPGQRRVSIAWLEKILAAD